jgi:pimeloyl-ACP methyl ester carboxylesterase
MSLPQFKSGFLPAADGAVKPYVTIGDGPAPMIVLPGAAEGLRTCVEVALYLAWFYRERAKDCRILILSRRQPLPERMGIERAADDMIEAVEQLGWGPSVWECLSASGPVGQWIAVKRPDLVRGLVLTSTYDCVAPRTRKVMRQWMEIAQHPAGLEAISGTLAQKYKPPAEVLAQIDPALLPSEGPPRDAERLTRILSELLELDQRSVTPRIECPTLVLGGAEDRVVPPDTQREMAARIPGSVLELAPGFGHFHDMENPAYQLRVRQFAVEMATPRS